MIKDMPINWVTEEQLEQIKNTTKTAFLRIEDKWQWRHYKDWKNNKEIYIRLHQWDAFKGWLIVEYIDYFKWKDIIHQNELIERLGFKTIKELKDYMWKLYGFEMEEDPYYFYIEFKYKTFIERKVI